MESWCPAWVERYRYKVPISKFLITKFLITFFLITVFLSNKIPKLQNS